MEMPYEDQNKRGDNYKEEAEFVGIFFEFWVSIGVAEQADSSAPKTNLVQWSGEWAYLDSSGNVPEMRSGSGKIACQTVTKADKITWSQYFQKRRRMFQTSQELRMLSSVTINCQITKIVMNSGYQLSEL